MDWLKLNNRYYRTREIPKFDESFYMSNEGVFENV